MRFDPLGDGISSIELVKKGTWGSDELIIEAARMSTDGGFRGWGPHTPMCAMQATEGVLDCDCKQDHVGDEKLLRYLYEHKHHTPFEMAGATFEIYAPIFVIREWHRHRTQSYNEMSGRYIELPDDYYVPSLDRIQKQSKKNKQGGDEPLSPQAQANSRQLIEAAYYWSRTAYDSLLEAGVAREVARMVLPVSQYSRFRAQANLRNWLGFLALRMDPAAQWEIRQYARAIASMLTERFPRVMGLFGEGRDDWPVDYRQNVGESS